jgi:hypothetical protein
MSHVFYFHNGRLTSQLFHVEKQLGQLSVDQVLGRLSFRLVLRGVVVVPQQPQHLVTGAAQTHEHQQSLGYNLICEFTHKLTFS